MSVHFQQCAAGSLPCCKLPLLSSAEVQQVQAYEPPVGVPTSKQECLEQWPLLSSILEALARLEPLKEKHVQPYEGVSCNQLSAYWHPACTKAAIHVM